jgi:hypothetical protein
MTSRDLVYWLQGFFELENPKTLNEEQTRCIKNHLALVFKHEIDPSMGDESHQVSLNKIHAGDLINNGGGGTSNPPFCPATTLIRC